MFYDCILTYFEAKPDALDPERLQGSYVTTSGGRNHTSYNEPAAGAAWGTSAAVETTKTTVETTWEMVGE